MPRPLVPQSDSSTARSARASGPFIATADLLARDDQLADAIHTDGVHRVRLGLVVDLERYISAVVDLTRRPEPLDAAIAGTLLYLASIYQPGEPKPAVHLVSRYPDLRGAIEEAAALNSVIPDTTGILTTLAPKSRILPAEFGPFVSEQDTRARYELLSRAGGGAFGEVFLARDRVLSEDGHPALVAVKILRKDKQPRGKAAFELMPDEATQSRRIDHESVVRVFDRGLAPTGDDFIVYEYLEGGTLSQFVRRRGGKLPLQDAVTMAIRVARGLQAAHSEGIVHCDIKPGNILLTSEGKPKLGDFGISAATDDPTEIGAMHRPSAILGNMAFISPEQFRREPGCLTNATDVYALGGVLFWMITGKLPNGGSVEQISKTHDRQTGRLAPPSACTENKAVDRDLDAIVARALAADRANRYQTAGEFAADLAAWQKCLPIAWTDPGPLHLFWLFWRRNPSLVAISAAALLFTIGFVIVTAYLDRSTRELAGEQRVNAALEHQLHAARAQAQAVFGNAARHRLPYRFLNPDATVTPAEVREAVALAQGVWTTATGDPESLVLLARTASELANLEDLIWRTEAVCWLINLGGEQITIDASTELRRDWAELLAAEHPFLVGLEALNHCAQVNRVVRGMLNVTNMSERVKLKRAASELADQLRADLRLLERTDASQVFTVLCLQKLVIVTGPAALDNVEAHKTFTAEYERMVRSATVPGLKQIDLDDSPR